MHPLWFLLPALALGVCTAVCAWSFYFETRGGIRPADRGDAAIAAAIILVGLGATLVCLVPVLAYLNPWSAL